MRRTTVTKTVSLALVVGLTGGVVLWAHDGMVHQSAVAACNTDAGAVETAVAEFKAENPMTTPTPTLLTTNTVNGKRFLKEWPSGAPLFSISLSSTGAVKVAVPATARARSYDAANSCTA